jgi:hypothetical protein
MKDTNWTQATTDVHAAMIGLISCLDSGRNAWLEIQVNGEQSFPIKKKNPALDDPFNWTMSYGVPRNERELNEYRFFNATEEDLTRNWYCAFGDQTAHDLYVNERKVTKELFRGYGIITPVRFEDIDKWRAEQGAGPFGYSWVTHWQPIRDIPYWIVDDSIKEVFVVCSDGKVQDRKESLRQAGEFLIKLSEK